MLGIHFNFGFPQASFLSRSKNSFYGVKESGLLLSVARRLGFDVCSSPASQSGKNNKKIISQGGLVLGSTQWGLLVIKLKLTRRSGHYLIQMGTFQDHLPQNRVFVMALTTLERVKVAKVRVASPAGFSSLTGLKNLPSQLYVTHDEPKPILVAAAEDAFKQCKVPHLERLMQYLRLRFPPNRRPTREMDMVEALMRHCWPDATDDQIKKAMASRNNKTDFSASLLSDPENLEHISTGLDADDFLEIKKTAKRIQQTSEKKPASTQGPAPAASGPRPATPARSGPATEGEAQSDRPWKLRPLPSGDEDISLVEARAFLPQGVAGVTLTKDVKRFSRWSVHYPRPSPPTNCSKSWGPNTGHSVSSALRWVLVQCWQWHKESTNEDCPYEL